MKRLLTVLIFVLLVSPTSSFAFVLQSNPDIDIVQESDISENLYLLGFDIDFNNFFENDLALIGGSTKIDGAIFGDLLSIGGETHLAGEIFGDSRLIGGDVIITGNTTGDLVVVGGKVSTEENAILNGDTFIVAGEVWLEGEVLDDIRIIAGEVHVKARFLGNVEITSQKVFIEDGTEVNEKFIYFAPNRAQMGSDIKIKSRIDYNQIQSINENQLIKKTILSFISFWSVIKFLATLFTAFILVYVFRIFSQRVSFLAINKFWKAFFLGIFSILLIPIATIILLASLFAMPIAGILFFSYLILLILVPPVSGIILGHYIQRLRNKGKKVEIDFVSTALGIVILTFLYLIPIAGPIIRTIFTILTFGAMVMYYSNMITLKKYKKDE
jgi:hypothetical protein